MMVCIESPTVHVINLTLIVSSSSRWSADDDEELFGVDTVGRWSGLCRRDCLSRIASIMGVNRIHERASWKTSEKQSKSEIN
jgi:hypothetical protein